MSTDRETGASPFLWEDGIYPHLMTEALGPEALAQEGDLSAPRPAISSTLRIKCVLPFLISQYIPPPASPIYHQTQITLQG